jgi:hypothetical protein
LSIADTFRKEPQQLTEEQAFAIRQTKDWAAEAEEALNEYQENAASKPDPRCFAVARTKLEEFVMWATKGITA